MPTRTKNPKKNASADAVSAPLSAVAAPAADDSVAMPRADRMGVQLRQARNAMNLTPRQVEDVLRIKEEYLLALENGHYHLLPTTAHAKGFLRSYAQYLGLGAQLTELQNRFIEETQGLPLTPQLLMPTALPEAKLPTRIFITGGIAAAVLVALIYVFASSPPEPETAPELPRAEAPAKPAAPKAETPVNMTPAPNAEEAAALSASLIPEVEPQQLPEPNKQGVSIRAVDDVWIQVQDKMGATIFSKLLRKGEEIPAPAGDQLTLTAGNGAGVQLVLNGSATRAIGNKAEVVRGIGLDAKAVSARLKAPAAAKPKPAPKPLATIETVTVPENAPTQE